MRIRVIKQVRPHVYKGRIDDLVNDDFVMERLAFSEARGTSVIWEVEKPVGYDELVKNHMPMMVASPRNLPETPEVLASGSGSLAAHR